MGGGGTFRALGPAMDLGHTLEDLEKLGAPRLNDFVVVCELQQFQKCFHSTLENLKMIGGSRWPQGKMSLHCPTEE